MSTVPLIRHGFAVPPSLEGKAKGEGRAADSRPYMEGAGYEQYHVFVGADNIRPNNLSIKHMGSGGSPLSQLR